MREKPIILVGIMGCGKTTVGQRLAKALGRAFYDSDWEIEKTSGKTIPDIFREDGEPVFRALEVEVLKKLLKTGSSVIAAGGGVLEDKGVKKMVKKKATSIWLTGDGDVFYKRAAAVGGRPLLAGPMAHELYLDLYHARQAAYARADFHVRSDGPNPETVIEAIKAALND